MNTDTQKTNESSRTGPQMNRRQMIKTVSASGVVAAYGTGVAPHSFTDPAQGQEEVVCAAAGGIGGGLFGGAAGAVVGAATGVRYCPISDSIDEGDISDDREDRIYETAESVVVGKDKWEKIALNEFQNQTDAEQTPFGRSAWTAIRTTTATYHANGEDRTAAKSKARQRVKEQATRSVVNLVEAWNGSMDAMAPEIAGERANDWGQIVADDNNMYPLAGAAPETAAWETELDGETVVIGNKREPSDFDLPVDPTDIEGRDEGLELVTYSADNDGDGTAYVCDPMYISSLSDWVTQYSNDFGSGALVVTHSKQDQIIVVDPTTFAGTFDQIKSAYDTIIGNVGTFVDSYYDEASFGEWEPSRALTPSQLYSEFASTGSNSRVAAELAASGLDVPEDAGTQAKISHPDLPVDEAWGWLYPRLTDKTINIEPGTTIVSADYELAYFIRVTVDTNETSVEVLSGNSDLQILDTEVREKKDDEYERDNAAGTDGEVVVWDTAKHGEEVPPPIEYPADHANWSLVVYGAENKSSHPPTDLTTSKTEEGTQYILPTTDLNDGELVNAVRVMGPFGFEQPVRYVADPTNIDPQEVQDRYDRMTDFYDQVRDELTDGGGIGGGGFFDGLPSLPGLNTIESAVVVFLAIAGLNAASG